MSLESEQTDKSVNNAINYGAVTWPATVGGLRVVDEVEGFGEDPMGLVVNSARDESDSCCIVDTRTHSAKTKTIIIAFDKTFEKGVCMIVGEVGFSLHFGQLIYIIVPRQLRTVGKPQINRSNICGSTIFR